MSENNKVITLIFKDQPVVCKLPNNFTELKKYTKSSLGIEDIDKITFFYENENQNEVQIKDDNNFNEFLSKYDPKIMNKIIIKEEAKDNSDIGQSELFGNDQINPSTLSVLQNNQDENNSNINNNAEASNITIASQFFGDEQKKDTLFIKKIDYLSKQFDNIQKIKEESKISNSNNDSKSNSNISNSINNSQQVLLSQQNNSFEEGNQINEDDKNTKIQNLTSIITQLESKIALLEQEKTELKKQNQLYQTTISKFQTEKTELEKSYNKKIQQSQNEIIFNKKKIEQSKNEKEKLQNEINYLKIDFNSKISKLEKENGQLKNEKSLLESSLCTTVHKNIKCEHCFTNPIIGYRYKCSQCNQNYNLCQKCYELNTDSGKHPHFFYRIKTFNENENNNMNNNINNNMNIINNNNFVQNNQNVKSYSYKCLTQDLKKLIYRGQFKTEMKILLQNDGNVNWPENTKLIWDKNNSHLQADDYPLKSVAPSGTITFNLKVNNLQNLKPNQYQIFFDFNVDGINYGNKLCVYIVVRKENKNEIIKQFRMKYKTPEEYLDDTISNLLDIYNGDFEATYFKLYFS